MKRTHHFNVHDALQGSLVENSHSNILMQLLCYCEQGRYVFLESLLQNRFGFNVDLASPVEFECEKAYASGLTVCLHRTHAPVCQFASIGHTPPA